MIKHLIQCWIITIACFISGWYVLDNAPIDSFTYNAFMTCILAFIILELVYFIKDKFKEIKHE